MVQNTRLPSASGSIFEKTQTQKFALSQARGGRKLKRPGQTSDYKRQLTEKQKMRFTYGITEKQLRRYVDEATEKKSPANCFTNGKIGIKT